MMHGMMHLIGVAGLGFALSSNFQNNSKYFLFRSDYYKSNYFLHEIQDLYFDYKNNDDVKAVFFDDF
jgi:hypothetical protein